MSHRTYGETRNCKGCRFWSEMIAHTVDGGVQAMCLSRMRYTSGYNTCMFWASFFDGAVDEPGSDPTRYEGEFE